MKAGRIKKASRPQISNPGRKTVGYVGYGPDQDAGDWERDSDGDAIALKSATSLPLPGTVIVMIPLDVSINCARRHLLKIIATIDAGETPEAIYLNDNIRDAAGEAKCDPN
jgi:hypothetical protein